MRKAAKVFIWIGMICGCYLIFPIIVGIYALNKLDTAKTKAELTTSAWLTFWFCNIIGGICMLKLDDFNPDTQKKDAYQVINNSIPSQTYNLDDLKKLKELLDDGIITQEEFDAKKKQILGLSPIKGTNNVPSNCVYDYEPSDNNIEIAAAIPVDLNLNHRGKGNEETKSEKVVIWLIVISSFIIFVAILMVLIEHFS